ncbi:putative signal peptide protein [Puccinia sorghi]|uniref:Putative signal peptide protein n=1 Tax=Puccinia sorghi TaxID=27349 RepID=A0A0L6VDY5_9BASI|nr:putative signal peptide protein [Puccinia sorghi]
MCFAAHKNQFIILISWWLTLKYKCLRSNLVDYLSGKIYTNQIPRRCLIEIRIKKFLNLLKETTNFSINISSGHIIVHWLYISTTNHNTMIHCNIVKPVERQTSSVLLLTEYPPTLHSSAHFIYWNHVVMIGSNIIKLLNVAKAMMPYFLVHLPRLCTLLAGDGLGPWNPSTATIPWAGDGVRRMFCHGKIRNID